MVNGVSDTQSSSPKASETPQCKNSASAPRLSPELNVHHFLAAIYANGNGRKITTHW